MIAIAHRRSVQQLLFMLTAGLILLLITGDYDCSALRFSETFLATPPKLNKVVIVGAGPAGLSAALILQQCHNCHDITVIERRSANSFESEKAYLYLLDGRGQQLTNLLGLTTRIYSKAVSSFDFRELNVLLPNGDAKVQNLPVGAMGNEEKYWLPRSALLDVFLKRIAEVNQQATVNDKNPPIKLVFDTTCSSFRVDDEGRTVVEVAGGRGYDCDLLIGCDGINSAVRTWLASNRDSQSRFGVTKYNSDAAGLRYKMITLRNRFLIPAATSSNGSSSSIGISNNGSSKLKQQSVPEKGYAIRSTGKTRRTRFSYGLLPVKGDNPRTANVICIPQHKIWTIQTLPELKQFLQQSIPQLPVGDYATDEELLRFLKAPPGVFPMPQHCNSAQHLFKAKSLSSSESNRDLDNYADKEVSSAPSEPVVGSAAVLVGDSLHAFPPDLGQGVNSALVDVLTLHESLKKSGDDIATAAPLYEKMRLPEAIALCKIMSFGYPHQYKQSPIKGRLFLLNFALRLALNKALPKFFAPPAFFMVQKRHQSYQEILRCAHGTTRNLLALVATILMLPFLRSLLLKAIPFR